MGGGAVVAGVSYGVDLVKRHSQTLTRKWFPRFMMLKNLEKVADYAGWIHAFSWLTLAAANRVDISEACIKASDEFKAAEEGRKVDVAGAHEIGKKVLAEMQQLSDFEKDEWRGEYDT